MTRTHGVHAGKTQLLTAPAVASTHSTIPFHMCDVIHITIHYITIVHVRNGSTPKIHRTRQMCIYIRVLDYGCRTTHGWTKTFRFETSILGQNANSYLFFFRLILSLDVPRVYVHAYRICDNASRGIYGKRFKLKAVSLEKRREVGLSQISRPWSHGTRFTRTRICSLSLFTFSDFLFVTTADRDTL